MVKVDKYISMISRMFTKKIRCKKNVSVLYMASIDTFIRGKEILNRFGL